MSDDSTGRLSRRQLIAGAAAAVAGVQGAMAASAPRAPRPEVQAPAILSNAQGGRRVRALVKIRPDLPASLETLRLRELTGRQVAIRVLAAQTCYSSVGQVLFSSGGPPFATVMGHGGVGIVEAVGPEVSVVRPGDRVVSNFHSHCGFCMPCVRGRSDQCLVSGGPEQPTADLDGMPVYSDMSGMTEIMVVNQEKCVPVYTDVSSEELAMLTCVGNTGLGMAMVKCPIDFGTDVVVFGAGPVGLAAIQGAAIKGAARIIVIEPIQYRRELAMTLGGTDAIDPHQYAGRRRKAATSMLDPAMDDWYEDELVDHVRSMVRPRSDRVFSGGGLFGPDHVIEAAGGNIYFDVPVSPAAGTGPDPSGLTALHQAWELCSRLGTTVSASRGYATDSVMEIPTNLFTDGWRHFWGGTCGGTNTRRDGPRYIRLMESGKLNMKALAQRTYPLDQAIQAWRDAMDRSVVATIVQPNAA